MKEFLSEKGVEFAYFDISLDFAALKRFLKIRDLSPLYEPIRGTGRIGIPCVVVNDEVILDLDEDTLIEKIKEA